MLAPNQLDYLIKVYYQENQVGDLDKLVNFVNADHSARRIWFGPGDRARLALKMIDEEFGRLLDRGDAVALKDHAEKYVERFAKRGVKFDDAGQLKLFKLLAQSELSRKTLKELTDAERDDFNDWKARYPEIPAADDFWNKLRELRRWGGNSLIFSRSLSRSVPGDAPPPPSRLTLSEEYALTFEPVDGAPDGGFKKLGSGGLKDVYLARQASTSQEVALKILRVPQNGQGSARASFGAEAKTQAQLMHPNIPQILSFAEDKGALVERYISGKTWAELIDERSLEENVATLVVVSQVVAYAHSKKIIHGDLKPENVMLGESGGRYNEIYVVDWGFAQSLDAPTDEQPQALRGTPDYCPPENARSDGRLSLATDVFTLGGVLYRILCGEAPYAQIRCERGALEAQLAAMNCSFAPIEEKAKDAPPELLEIAQKALRQDPNKRYVSAKEFVDALERYRRRAGLSKRLSAAINAFDAIPQTAANSLLPLVETTNEFRLIREEAAETDGADAPSELFKRAVEREGEARRLLIRNALETQNFEVAEAQIVAEREFEEKLQAFPGLLPDEPGADARAEELQAAREKREREKEAESRNAELELAAKIAKMRAIEQAVAPLADARWRQGEVATLASSGEPELYATQLHLAERSGIFLEAVSSRNAFVNSIAFSSDEKYVATFVPNLGTTIYRAPNKEIALDDDHFLAVAHFPTFELDLLTWRLLANPAFVSENADEPELAARFLLYSNKGACEFLRFEESGATARTFRDLNPFDSENDRVNVVLGTPCFATNAAGETRLYVADSLGFASICSFPDGRLLKRFRLCDPVEKEGTPPIPELVATPDGETLFSAGLDGSFKRWSGDGEELETLDLPLSAVDWSKTERLLRALETSPDGRVLYASDESGKFVVWNVPEKSPIYVGREPNGPEPLLGEPSVSPIYRLDDDRFLTLCANDRRRIWDLSRRDENGVPANVELREANAVAEDAGPALIAAAISPSRRVLALFSLPSCQLTLCDVEANAPIAGSEGLCLGETPLKTLSAAAYLPSSDRFLIGSGSEISPQVAAFAAPTLRFATEYQPPADLFRTRLLRERGAPVAFAVPAVGGKFAVAFTTGDILLYQDGDDEPTGELDVPFRLDQYLLGAKRLPLTPEDAFNEALRVAYAAQRSLDAAEELNRLVDSDFLDALFGGARTDVDNPPLLAASPDGTRLIGKSVQGDKLFLWDWEKGSVVQRFPSPRIKDLTRKNFTDAVKIAKNENDFAPLDACFAKLQRAMACKATLGLAFLDDATALEIKSDASLVRYSLETGERVETSPFTRLPATQQLGFLPLIARFANSCRLSTDRKRLAIGFRDNCVAVVEIETNRLLLFTSEFAKPLPNRSADYRETTTIENSIEFAWSRNDELLCLACPDGRAVLLETSGFAPLETFVVGEKSQNGRIPFAVYPFFTRDDKLVTLDTRGFLKRWDFRPSPEKATPLDVRGGACLSGTSRTNVWASATLWRPDSRAFFVKDGAQELYRRAKIHSFARLTEPGATRETFLLLGENGFLSAVDETGAPVATDVDWNRGVPGATPEALAAVGESSEEEPDPEFSLESAAQERVQYLAIMATNSEIQELTGNAIPNFNAGEKKAGFIDVASSPNRRAFAAIGKEDGYLYVMTTAEANAGWRLALKLADENDSFVNLAFSPDSRELTATTDRGFTVFLNFNEAPDAPDELVWSQAWRQYLYRGARGRGALAYAPSGRFLLQTGIGPYVWIWDVAAAELAQRIKLDFYDCDINFAPPITALAPLRLNDDADAFVVAGFDGVLRFYRYDESKSRFEAAYIISPKTLSEMIEPADRANRSSDDASRPLFWRSSRRVQSLSLSDDEQTLYVGSFTDVSSYDLNEIRRNIAALPEYWRNFDFERATRLGAAPTGLCAVERDRLVPFRPTEPR